MQNDRLAIRRALHSYPAAKKPVVDIQNVELGWSGIATLAGPSGAGKTTLFRLILGWFQSSEQSICIFEPQIDPSLQVRMVGAHSSLLPWFTVDRNIALQADGNGDALRLIDAFKLSREVCSAYPSQLSLGMYKRIELLIAICAKPSLLLIDELFSSIDDATKDAVIEALRSYMADRRVWVIAHENELRSQISSTGYKLVLSANTVVGIERA